MLAWVRIAGRYIRYPPSMLHSLRLTALNLFANHVQANGWRGESVNAFDIGNDDCSAVVTQARVDRVGAVPSTQWTVTPR